MWLPNEDAGRLVHRCRKIHPLAADKEPLGQPLRNDARGAIGQRRPQWQPQHGRSTERSGVYGVQGVTSSHQTAG